MQSLDQTAYYISTVLVGGVWWEFFCIQMLFLQANKAIKALPLNRHKGSRYLSVGSKAGSWFEDWQKLQPGRWIKPGLRKGDSSD